MVSSLFVSAVTTAPVTPPTTAVASPDRIDAFGEAMARQQGPAEAPSATRIAALGSADPVASASKTQVADIDAQERARRGLGLEGIDRPAAAPGGGDMILDGIQKLRGVFDAREARISDVMGSGPLDAGAMMSLQMEVTNFTLLVDLTSKLTGKSTQAFETLMKGQ